jgi:transcriptional antiterminator Rof (Rho-off)
VQGVLDAGLLLLHLDLGRRTDVDLGHAAESLARRSFELLAVVVAGGRIDLVLDRLDAALDIS